MNTRTKLQKLVRATLILATLSAMGVAALAAGPPSSGPTTGVTKETREKMAVLHEQMAACLRSDKSMADCHAEMRRSCQESLGVQGCPMMRMGNGHHGTRRPTAKSTDKS